LGAGDGGDVFVGGEAGGVDGVSADGAADVADGAGGEGRDGAGGVRVHDVELVCFGAEVGGVWAALLGL